MKQVLYKGIPLASVSIVVAVPEPFSLSVSADPSWGKKIFLEERSGGPGMGDQGMTAHRAADLAQALTKAGIIMDDIEIRDDGADKLRERAARLEERNGSAWADLQDTLDSAVHDLASRGASAQNNTGADEQIEYLVMELGEGEVERMIAAAEEIQEGEDKDAELRASRHGEPMCTKPQMIGNRCATCGLVSSLPDLKPSEGESNGE